MFTVDEPFVLVSVGAIGLDVVGVSVVLSSFAITVVPGVVGEIIELGIVAVTAVPVVIGGSIVLVVVCVTVIVIAGEAVTMVLVVAGDDVASEDENADSSKA